MQYKIKDGDKKSRLKQTLGNVRYLSKQAIRAVREGLMSLGMTFSFIPEVQITKNYCKITMKIHWGYIGKYIRIFEKKNEPERIEKD